MNIKEYIESGLLEAYALGALTESERVAVEADIAMYPELAAELAIIEQSLQQFAESQAEEPPAFMQEKIWQELDSAEEDEWSGKIPQAQPKSVPLQPEQPAAKQPNFMRAAIWIAVIVSALTNFILLSQRNVAREEKDKLASKLDSLSAQQESLASQLGDYKKELDMMSDPDVKTVVMRKEGETGMAGMVYWSKDKEEAYVSLHNLPIPPTGKQYQMWIIQDGKPVDMGVIDNKMVETPGMMKKLSVSAGGLQAFAISIENEGGSPTPTQVYMVGGV